LLLQSFYISRLHRGAVLRRLHQVSEALQKILFENLLRSLENRLGRSQRQCGLILKLLRDQAIDRPGRQRRQGYHRRHDRRQHFRAKADSEERLEFFHELKALAGS